MITNTMNMNITQDNEKIKNIQIIISELCFNCPNNFPYNQNAVKNSIYENKRLFILNLSFDLFKSYIKSKNKIHLFFLTKNAILDLLNKYKSNS